jgi:adenylate kinase
MGFLPDLVIMGMQGCGKGTVASRLSEKYGYKIFEMSAKLVEEKEKNPAFRKKIEKVMAEGRLVGPGIIMGVVEKFLSSVDEYTPILWDGVPRTLQQLKKFTKFLNHHGRKMPVGMLVDVSSEVALQRMAGRGRDDDKDEKARENRIHFFLSETVPAIERYEEITGMSLLKLNGEQGPQDVFHDAVDLIENEVKVLRQV